MCLDPAFQSSANETWQIKFVLSGEEELRECGKHIDSDFKGFYITRLDLMLKARRKRREDLLQYYNEAVFPEHHIAVGVDDGRSQEEQELWKAMQAEDDDED